jgi:hypothetical protein
MALGAHAVRDLMVDGESIAAMARMNRGERDIHGSIRYGRPNGSPQRRTAP